MPSWFSHGSCPVSRLVAALVLVAAVAYAEPTNVYMVAHSHCDYGCVTVTCYLNLCLTPTGDRLLQVARRWLRTPLEYFDYEVSHILDTSMAAVDADESLRFHWAETAWLPLWLNQGDADAKLALLRRLLSQKRLEILGGALHAQSQASAMGE
jgi:hypothetical protein